jgi:hypothetical protein
VARGPERHTSYGIPGDDGLNCIFQEMNCISQVIGCRIGNTCNWEAHFQAHSMFLSICRPPDKFCSRHSGCGEHLVGGETPLPTALNISFVIMNACKSDTPGLEGKKPCGAVRPCGVLGPGLVERAQPWMSMAVNKAEIGGYDWLTGSGLSPPYFMFYKGVQEAVYLTSSQLCFSCLMTCSRY